MPTSRLEIDLAAVRRNVGILRQALDAPREAAPAGAGAPAGATPTPAAGPRVDLCAVIKQDGYALGAPRLARTLAGLGVGMLAVFDLDEARALADVPISTPILVLMPVRAIERQDPVYRLAVRQRLHLVVHDLGQVQELIAVASRLGARLPVHVQLDTGMSRGGSLEPEATKMVEAVLASQRLLLAGLMTHFSSPSSDDAYTREQARGFRGWIDGLKPMLSAAFGAGGSGTAGAAGPLVIHAANTAATLRGRSFHANLVRVGQGLYGYGLESFTDPLAVEFASFGKQLQPAVRWLSRIVHVHEVPKGAPVGYGRTFKAARPTRVALVPVGYADGYPLALSNTGKVVLTGRPWDRQRAGAGERAEAFERPAQAPVIGRVSMDQLTIDVSGLPDRLACVGAEVELIGADPQAPNHLPTLAKAAGTINHEMLVRLAERIERIYVAPMGEADTTPAAPVVGRTGTPLATAV